MKKNMFITLLAAGLLVISCRQEQQSYTGLEKLIVDVFDPQPGEKVLIMTDLPHGDLTDHQLWTDRRQLAEEWRSVFAGLEDRLQISVASLMTYPATGAHNSPLPETGTIDGSQMALDKIIADTNIVVALTEYSATASLIDYTRLFPELRAASMPGVTRAMSDTALAADYAEMAPRCERLGQALDRAEGASLAFSTGDKLYIDLRFRDPHVDDGRLPADKIGDRVINLPSGEAYIAPYEGERPGESSATHGTVPLPAGDDAFVRIRLEENRVVEVLGEGPAADHLREGFSVDDGGRNLAELGLGCNDMAILTGNVVEDEKVYGIHLAGGLSEHIGGTVGVDDFIDPSTVQHTDVVFPFGGEIEPTSLTFYFNDGTSEAIIQDGEYVLFDDAAN